MKVVAILAANGHANAPRKATLVVPPKPAPGLVGLTVAASVGDYRAGDEIWCEPIEPEEYGRALNRDVILPRPAGRFLFGRLIGREGNKLQLLPPGAGGRQQVGDRPAVGGDGGEAGAVIVEPINQGRTISDCAVLAARSSLRRHSRR